MTKEIKWAYGITTVPSRFYDLLPTTIASLRDAGFDKPRLFVDGSSDPDSFLRAYDLEITNRRQRIRTYGNWTLALFELLIRNPSCHRYAIFQDDFVTYKNLRRYLEMCELKPKTYWNLYTFPSNHEPLPSKDYEGWYESNQLGRSAIALVFDRQGVVDLLSSESFIRKPLGVGDKSHSSIDGGIIEALSRKGYKEMVHMPSLTQHYGKISSIESTKNHDGQKTAPSYRGETYDALDLLRPKEHNK